MSEVRNPQRDPSPGPAPKRRERGSTLIEVAIAIAILTFALVGVASSFGSNAAAVDRARGLNKASHFMEEVLDSMAAQPFENLASLNGNVLYDNGTASRSIYRIQITVSQAAIDLFQIRLVLSQVRSGNVITKVITYRSRR